MFHPVRCHIRHTIPLILPFEVSLVPTPGEITILLQQAEAGVQRAADDLYRLVEADLRAIAGRRKRRFEDPLGSSTTMLVDDAFLRLVGGHVTEWQPGDRGKFFSYVATKIHDLLIESVRSKQAVKRGGDRRQVSFEVLEPSEDSDSDFILDLHEALTRFEKFAPNEVRAFRIYYFLGSTFDETAEVLGVSATEAKRLCKKAQLWLQHELKEYHDAA